MTTAGAGAGYDLRRGISALLFLQASANAFDAYSALNSSPWTSENFGADPAKAKSCREYVTHAVVISSLYGVTSGVLAGKLWPWPIIGTAIVDVYMVWLYGRALRRGAAAGSDSWAKT